MTSLGWMEAYREMGKELLARGFNGGGRVCVILGTYKRMLEIMKYNEIRWTRI
jgi:hypothetical protein